MVPLLVSLASSVWVVVVVVVRGREEGGKRGLDMGTGDTRTLGHTTHWRAHTQLHPRIAMFGWLSLAETARNL